MKLYILLLFYYVMQVSVVELLSFIVKHVEYSFISELLHIVFGLVGLQISHHITIAYL